MGKVERLRKIVEPFAALVLGSRHCTLQHLNRPASPASLHHRYYTQSKSLYSMFIDGSIP